MEGLRVSFIESAQLYLFLLHVFKVYMNTYLDVPTYGSKEDYSSVKVEKYRFIETSTKLVRGHFVTMCFVFFHQIINRTLLL